MPRLTEVFKIGEDAGTGHDDVLPVRVDMEEAELRKLANDNGWDVIPGSVPGVYDKRHWKMMQGMTYDDPDKIPQGVVAAGSGKNPMSSMLMARSDAAKKLANLVHSHKEDLPDYIPNIWEVWEKLQDVTKQELGAQDLESLTPGGGALNWEDEAPGEGEGEEDDEDTMPRRDYIAAKAQGKDPWADRKKKD